MTSIGWTIAGFALLATLILTVLLAMFAWRLLARYVDFVLQLPRWIVIVAFLLFPPALIFFIVGLIPHARWVARTDKELAGELEEHMWQLFPPSEHIKGDEKTRREVAKKRRALGYVN
jgi:membrane protein implicated in regulation of membrane protease activity